MFKNNYGLIVIIISVIVCTSTSKGSFLLMDLTPLDVNLMEIISQDKGEGTDIQKLEDQCLLLLNDYNSPEDKGKIYANIASMYAGHGYSSPNDIRIAKTAEYCKKALKYPLDTLTTGETYMRLGDSQIVHYSNRPYEEFAKARKESIVTCLKGLKIALDNNAPKEWEGPPGVSKYDIDSGAPGYDKIVKEHEMQIDACKKWEIREKFHFLRRGGIESCVDLYAYKPPYDINELESFAKDILKGHDDAIDEIMSKAHQLIPQQGNK